MTRDDDMGRDPHERVRAVLGEDWFRDDAQAPPPVDDAERVPTPEEAPGADAAEASGGGLVKSSAGMAAGTLTSRVTGTVRDIAIVAAIGFGVFADTFSVANTVPNIVYILLAGGALNAVFIPQLVRHMKEDGDGGDDYAHRLLTLVALILIGVTLVAVLAAPLLIDLYGPSTWSASDVSTATLFARFCLPQILFYGLFAMFSQVLNARGRFAGPAFAPIANNVVVIATALLFIAVVGSTDPTTATVTSGQIAILGIGTTLGIAVQAAILLPMMRRAGFGWRPRFGFRGYGLGKVRYLAGWTFVFVLTNQITYVVIARLASAANVIAQDSGAALSAGYTSYSKAYLLFILPHSIVTVSIVTFLLPRMSRAAAAGRPDAVARDVGIGTTLAAAVIMPAAVVLFILGPKVAVVLFGVGAAGALDARFVGVILQAFVIGLLPFTIFYVLLRGWYAFEDTRTPALVNLGMNAVNVAAAVGLWAVAPDRWKVPALALGYAISYTVTVPVAWRLLRRRTGPLPTFVVIRTLVRVALASTVAGLLVLAIALGLTEWWGTGRGASLVIVLLAGAAGGAVYLATARRLRVQEVSEVLDLVGARLRPRRASTS